MLKIPTEMPSWKIGHDSQTLFLDTQIFDDTFTLYTTTSVFGDNRENPRCVAGFSLGNTTNDDIYRRQSFEAIAIGGFGDCRKATPRN